MLLKHVADHEGIAPRLIANADDLEQIALDKTDGIKAMHGWRYEIFGQYADAIKSGKLAVAVKNNATMLVPVAD